MIDEAERFYMVRIPVDQVNFIHEVRGAEKRTPFFNLSPTNLLMSCSSLLTRFNAICLHFAQCNQSPEKIKGRGQQLDCGWIVVLKTTPWKAMEALSPTKSKARSPPSSSAHVPANRARIPYCLQAQHSIQERASGDMGK